MNPTASNQRVALDCFDLSELCGGAELSAAADVRGAAVSAPVRHRKQISATAKRRQVCAIQILFLFLLISLPAASIAETHDLATIGIVAPKTVTLSTAQRQIIKPVVVVIQNRSPQNEIIPDAETLAQLVTLEAKTLGACPNLRAVLVPPARFPITLRSKAKLNVVFNVLFGCANDRATTRRGSTHDDFKYTATVHHEALDGLSDDHPADDICPHDTLPGGIAPNPDGTIIDKGAGALKPDGTRGGDILTDVILDAPAGNLPPILYPVAGRVINVGATLNIQLVASDLTADPLTFTAGPSPLPPNTSFKPATGLFTFTPGPAQAGVFVFGFRVSDGTGRAARSVRIRVLPSAGGVKIATPKILSTRRIGPREIEYTLQASLLNTGAAIGGVTATLTGTPSHTTIVSGTLDFGRVESLVRLTSPGTIVVRHDPRYPFRLTDFKWTLSFTPRAPTVAAPLSPTMLTAVDVTGFADPKATLEIVGGTSTVTGTASTTGAFKISVPLQPNRINKLFVTALGSASQRSAPVPVDVTQDAQPPTLFMDFPAADAELTSDAVVVSGRVGDMLSGYQGLAVSVNGKAASVNVGIGNNGTFERPAVPLALGNNTLTATATDVNGNTVSRQITVKRIAIVGPQILQVSGDMQNAQMHARLPQPIIVKVVNTDSTPVANKLVHFEVTRSDGRLVADPAATAGTLTLQIRTDANGFARAWWNVGADAGRANNRVAVTSQDIAGTVFFCASGDPGPVHQINIGTATIKKPKPAAPRPSPSAPGPATCAMASITCPSHSPSGRAAEK